MTKDRPPAPGTEESSDTLASSEPTNSVTETPSEAVTNALTSVESNPLIRTSFDGHCLNGDIFDSIKDVTCADNFKSLESDFNENFDSIEGQFLPSMKHLYIRCPENCAEASATTGLTVHPAIANICLSAIADRAIDHTGGVISVSMTKAQKA